MIAHDRYGVSQQVYCFSRHVYLLRSWYFMTLLAHVSAVTSETLFKKNNKTHHRQRESQLSNPHLPRLIIDGAKGNHRIRIWLQHQPGKLQKQNIRCNLDPRPARPSGRPWTVMILLHETSICYRKGTPVGMKLMHTQLSWVEVGGFMLVGLSWWANSAGGFLMVS